MNDLAARPLKSLNHTSSGTVHQEAIVAVSASPGLRELKSNSVASTRVRDVNTHVRRGVSNELVEETKPRLSPRIRRNKKALCETLNSNAVATKSLAAV